MAGLLERFGRALGLLANPGAVRNAAAELSSERESRAEIDRRFGRPDDPPPHGEAA